jgi:hypothetical protein
MTGKPRKRTTLRTPWNRFPVRRNPTTLVAEDPEGAAKARLREGGLEHDNRDPLRHVPLKEPYAAKSGNRAPEDGSPATVTKLKKKGRPQGTGN